MVTGQGIGWLIRLITDFSYIYEKSRMVTFNESNSIQVKGPNYIIDVIKRQKPLIDVIKSQDNILKNIASSIDLWIEKLEKNYKDANETESPLPEKLTFEDAREYIRNENLDSAKDWQKWSKSSNRPDDIPANPTSYSNEWINWGDFLGTNTIATQNKQYLSAKEAKPVLKKLFKEYDIKNLNDWRKFAKTHAKLLDELHLPSILLRTYSKQNAERKSKK